MPRWHSGLAVTYSWVQFPPDYSCATTLDKLFTPTLSRAEGHCDCWNMLVQKRGFPGIGCAQCCSSANLCEKTSTSTRAPSVSTATRQKTWLDDRLLYLAVILLLFLVPNVITPQVEILKCRWFWRHFIWWSLRALEGFPLNSFLQTAVQSGSADI